MRLYGFDLQFEETHAVRLYGLRSILPSANVFTASPDPEGITGPQPWIDNEDP